MRRKFFNESRNVSALMVFTGQHNLFREAGLPIHLSDSRTGPNTLREVGMLIIFFGGSVDIPSTPSLIP